jgi:hypothetical protein
VSLETFNQIVSQQDLWEHFAKLLIYTASRVYEHCAQISQMSAYDIIRFQLVELMQEPDAIRKNTTAAAYIKSRTYLSRSGIMRILAELRTGKYITMARGYCSTFTICHENIDSQCACTREKRYN